MDDKITRDSKLSAASKIVAAYASNSAVALKEADLIHAFKAVYQAIDETLPNADPRKVGLI